VIIFEARRLAVANSITDFAEATSWGYSFMNRHGLSMCTRTRIAQKMTAEYKMNIL
jgi:hypothetical protein